MIDWIEILYNKLKENMTIVRLKDGLGKVKLYRVVRSKKRFGVCLQEIDQAEAKMLLQFKK